MFKLGIGNGFGLKGQKSRLGLAAIWRGFELYECLQVLTPFTTNGVRKRQSIVLITINWYIILLSNVSVNVNVMLSTLNASIMDDDRPVGPLQKNASCLLLSIITSDDITEIYTQSITQEIETPFRETIQFNRHSKRVSY